jgi:homoserine O-acetyltransferase
MSSARTLFDLGQEFGSMDEAFKKMKARVLMIGVNTDMLFVPSEIKSYLEPMSKAGVNFTYHEIKTGNGHLGGALDSRSAPSRIVGKPFFVI